MFGETAKQLAGSSPSELLFLMERAITFCRNGIVIVDATRPDLPVIFVNPAFEKLTGYAAAEILGRNCRLLQRNDRNQPEIEQMKMAILEAQECQVILRNYRQDGTMFWSEVHISPVFNHKKELTHFIGIQTDVTERKRLEIKLKTANQQLKELAITDGLTQLANRRRFDEYLSQEWKRAARGQIPISLILGDVDFFKAYNDTYGHQAGDECLRDCGAAIMHSVKRPADLAARYGGEEFVVLLPQTETSGAICIAQQIREKIAALKIVHAQSQASPHVTLSFGIATLIADSIESPEKLILAADQALYQAKEQGRDRYVIYSPELDSLASPKKVKCRSLTFQLATLKSFNE